VRHLQHGHAMMKTISVLALGALAVGCHLDKLLTGSGGGPRPTSHAPPAGLRFATQPPQSASVSQLIRVDVSVVDSAGVLVAGAETVMVVVALDAGSVSLGGTTTAHPVRGVASFPDLSVNQAGTYRLVASALGFQARSDQFEIKPPPPTTGDLTVTTSTTGTDLDPDGYTVTLDGSTNQSIGSNDATGVTFPNLPAGSHSVALSGVASNCTVSGGTSHGVTIVAGQPNSTAFSVTCTPIPPTTGGLTVTTSTSGSDLDPDGYTVTVDAGNSQPIGPNSTGVTFTNLSAGNHPVVLSGVASNCSVSGGTSHTVTVIAGQTISHGFTVTCTAIPPTTGDLVVTTTTSGADLPPDGYTAIVDGAQRAIGTRGSVTFPGLSAGTHTVGLSDLASNCAVSGQNPRSANVPAGGVGHADFAISCTALPPPNHAPVVNAGGDQTILLALGSVTINPSFTDQDGDGPWAYTIDWGDGSSSTGSRSSQGGFSASHSYGLVSTNTVTVTVTDSHGLSGSDQATIKVIVGLP